MKTREIWHEILINAVPAQTYLAVTEVKRLAHWWTTDVRGVPGSNILEFWFSGYCGSVMQVTTLKADELVKWRVVGGGVEDWIGTELAFNIFRNEGKTLLQFRHSNWQDDAKTFPHCSMGWAIFLLSLKEFVETGKGRPHPYDMPVNMWRPPNHEAVCDQASSGEGE